jgi:biopolymer transport protein ExbD
MQIQDESQPYDTINITPMLDLAYVLLVIFILMTTAGVQGLTMNLPKPSNKPSTEQHEVKIVQIQESGAGNSPWRHQGPGPQICGNDQG